MVRHAFSPYLWPAWLCWLRNHETMATSARVDDHPDHYAAYRFSDQYLLELAIGMGTVSTTILSL